MKLVEAHAVALQHVCATMLGCVQVPLNEEEVAAVTVAAQREARAAAARALPEAASPA